MSKVSIKDIRSAGEFQTCANWNIIFGDLTDIVDDAQNLNIKCQSIETVRSSSGFEYHIDFLETVDGSTYAALNEIVMNRPYMKIFTLNMVGDPVITDSVNLSESDVEVSRILNHEQGVLTITLSVVSK